MMLEKLTKQTGSKQEPLSDKLGARKASPQASALSAPLGAALSRSPSVMRSGAASLSGIARTGQAPSQGAKGSESKLKVYEVEIAGVPLRLKSSLSGDAVKELVTLVDRQIRAALPSAKTGSIQNAAILASLNLAESLMALRESAIQELDAIESGALKILSALEDSKN